MLKEVGEAGAAFFFPRGADVGGEGYGDHRVGFIYVEDNVEAVCQFKFFVGYGKVGFDGCCVGRFRLGYVAGC